MKISPNFVLQEFVPKPIFDQYGDKAIWFIDFRIVEGAEWIRSLFNAPVTINNWHTGGPFQNRGFRPPATTVGAHLSQHKFGRAIDINVKGFTAEQVHDYLIEHQDETVKYWTTIEAKEDTPGWTHLDVRVTKSNQILIVKP
jgi:hypothetical protein